MEEQLSAPAMARDRALAPHIPPALEAPEIPLLSVGLQAMSLSDQSQQQQNNEEDKEKYTLLMKVACSGGTPKILSPSSVQQAMTRAWRNNFHKVSQVNQSVFKAHFSTFEAMMFVYTRQPWTVGSDVMLIEFESPGKDIQKGDYKFEFVYATVRAYGIPKKHRSFKILKDILNLVGSQSEFHELRQVMLESRPDYIWGIAKLKVGVPIYDRVKLLYSVNEAGITYLNYEKIGRICLFCGLMFHTVGNCHLRQQIVTEKIQSGQADQAQQVPFQRYGSWIIEPADIPSSFAIQGEGSNPIFSTYQSPHIDRFQRAYRSTPLRQRINEDSNAAMTRRRLQFGEQSSAMAEEQQLEERIVRPPRRIDAGNQSQGGALINIELHGGHVDRTVSASASAGQAVLENIPGGNERSAGLGTIIQQGQFSPSGSMGLTTLPYPLEEEEQILENLRRTAGHGQIPHTTPPASLQSALDPSDQMLPGTSLNSHLLTHTDPATPILNPHPFSPAKSPPKRTGASLDFAASPAAKRAAPAPGQDGGGGGVNLKAVHIPPGGAAGAQGQILFAHSPPPAIETGTILDTQLEGVGGSGAFPVAVQGITEVRGGGGILGARPSNSNRSRSNLSPSLSTARGRNRRRPSGWDVSEDANARASHGAFGITHHKPGSSTWRRIRRPEEVALGSVGGRDSGPSMGIFGVPNAASNRPSPALSSSTDRADHDPWPLHTPSPSHSVASQDTRQGGFSPPPIAREYYVGVDGSFGGDATGSQTKVQSQAQLGSSSNDATHVVCDDSGRVSVEMDLEAAAPALKAPRAP